MAGSTVVVSVLADVKKFTSGFDQATRSTGGLLRGVGRLGAGLGLAVGGMAAAIGALALKGGIARALNIEDARAVLGALGHDVKATDAIMQNALASVKGTAFGLGDAAKVAASTVAAGIKPGEELERTLRLTANAAALAKVGMGDMGQILNKVWTAGRVQTMELNQLADRGIPIWTKLADQYGVTATELRAMVSRGEVDAQTFATVLEETVGPAALAMGSTVRGGWANMLAAFSRGGEAFVGGSLPIVGSAFAAITVAVDSVTSKIAPHMEAFWARAAEVALPVLETIGPAISGFVDRLSSMASGIDFGQLAELASIFSPLGLVLRAVQPLLPQIGAAFSEIGSTLASQLAPMLPQVTGLVGELVNALSGTLAEIIPVLVPMIVTLAEVLGSVLGAVLPVLVPLIGTLVSALMPVVSAILPPLAMLFGLVGEILTGVVVPIIQQLVPFIVQLVNAFAPVITVVGELVGTLLGGLIPVLAAVIGPVLDLIAPILGILLPILQQLVGVVAFVAEVLATVLGGAIGVIVKLFEGDFAGALQIAQETFSAVWDAIVSFFGQTVSNIGQLVGGIGDFFAGVWDGIVGFFKQGVANAVGIVTGLISFFGSIPSRIMGFFSGAVTWLTEAGRNIVQGLLDGAGSLLSGIGNFFLNMLPGWIVGPFKAALGIASPSRLFAGLGGNVIQGLEQGLSASNSIRSIMGDISDQVVSSFDVQLGTLDIATPEGLALRNAAATAGLNYNVNVVQNYPTTQDPIRKLKDDAESVIAGIWT